jgi:hypothetical protein
MKEGKTKTVTDCRRLRSSGAPCGILGGFLDWKKC